MKRTETKYLVILNTKGINSYEVFGNLKGATIYIHEHLQEHYLDYDVKMMYSYQTLRRKISKRKIYDKWTKKIKDTEVTILKLDIRKLYQGKEENKELARLVTK